jgi:hypothetical protein
MYYKDGTLYEYYLSNKLLKVKNVGWLDKNHDFNKMKCQHGFLEKMYSIVLSDRGFVSRINQMRGTHVCNLCGQHEFSNPFIGSCELLVPGREGDAYYAAPSMIIHYMEAHNYCPSQEFIDAVMALDTNMEFNGQNVYDALVRQLG